MGRTDGKEGCGRCGLSTVVDAVEDDEDAENRSDPFEGRSIEVDERELRLVSTPAVLAGRAKRWLDGTANRLIYGD